MKQQNFYPALFVVVLLVTGWSQINTVKAVSVEESRLSKNSVVVRLTAQEVEKARKKTNATIYGADVARKMLRLAGVPESVSGKVAAVAVWAVLCRKYEGDIYRYAKKTPKGNNLTLKYSGVDLEGVRKVWAASGAADHVMPGGEVTKMIINTINRLLNAVLK